MSKFDLAAVDLKLIETWDDAQELMSWLGERRDFLATDVETTGLNVGHDKIRLCQFGDVRKGYALAWEDWRGLCREVIQGYEGKQVAHNLIFDSKMLKNAGAVIPQRWAHDTMIMGHIIDPAHTVALKPMATRYIDKRASFGQNALAEAKKQGGWGWHNVPIDHPAFWLYSALDTVLTAALAELLWPQVQENPGYLEAYEIELGAIHVLRDAELAGMQIDGKYCALAVQELDRRLMELLPQLPCSPNADKAIVNFLMSNGCQLFKKTDAGNWSVDGEVLDYWAIHAPEAIRPTCAALRQARRYMKLLSSYLAPFERMAVPNSDQRWGAHTTFNEARDWVFPDKFALHCNIRPCGAITSRMSITDPALQTLPRGRFIRDAFMAREGTQLVIADYSQMELRVMAHYADETAMLQAFAEGKDLHNFVAESCYGDAYTKPQRGVAKNAGFAKIYGAGIEKFALTAKITVPEATSFLADYDEMFPGVSAWQDRTIQEIAARGGNTRRGTGWVDLRYGRHIPVPVAKAYAGCNYQIQGSCAQVLKRKLIELSDAGLHDYIRLPVHDEVLLEVPRADTVDAEAELRDIRNRTREYDVEQARAIMNEVMPDRDSFKVVLEAEAEIYDRWGFKYRGSDYKPLLPGYFGE